MEEYHIKHGVSEDAEDDRSIIRKALRVSKMLLKRILDRTKTGYAIHSWNRFEAKWGRLRLFTSTDTNNPDLRQCYVTREHVNEDNQEIYEDEAMEIYDFDGKIYQRDVTLLFDILKKHHEEFWD